LRRPRLYQSCSAIEEEEEEELNHITRYRQQVDNTREKCILLNEEYFCKDKLQKIVARYLIIIIPRQQWHREEQTFSSNRLSAG
jgi:hypothetical protein